MYQNVLSNDDFNFATVKLYPNPLKNGNMLYLHGIDNGYNFKLFDLNGRLVFSNNSFSNNIELPFVETGIYLVKIETNDKKILNFKLWIM